VTDLGSMLEREAVVSRRTAVDGVRPGFAYRDEPLTPIDSGWQVMVGDETPDELDDPSQIVIRSLGSLIDRWPELGPMFTTGAVGGEWIWDAASSSYVPLVRRS
jgi:hypothetical protein